MNMYKNIMPLILASQSPRRRRLIEELGIKCMVVPSNVYEEIDVKQITKPDGIVERLAWSKACNVEHYMHGFTGAILAADTLVIHEGEIFGKPLNTEEARNMLRSLSGNAHHVWTGVCILLIAQPVKSLVWSSCTKVIFRTLTENEIASYIYTQEPLDKAGAYGIQGLANGFVKEIHGSYTNVVGLPLAETIEVLLNMGVISPCREYNL